MKRVPPVVRLLGYSRGAFMAAILLPMTFGLGFIPPAKAESQPPLVVLAAKKLGIKACLPAITQIATADTAGATEQDIVLDWNRKAPDSSPFFSMTALSDGTRRAILSITATPLKPRGCALMVQRIFSSTDTCAVIAQKNLPSFIGGRLIDGVLVYSNPSDPEETYTLMQNSNNCSVIFRNNIPKWSPPHE